GCWAMLCAGRWALGAVCWCAAVLCAALRCWRAALCCCCWWDFFFFFFFFFALWKLILIQN
ncbi:MAG: hypothetical protein N7Q72_01460, partial [Spiroplasma sp. Tabriz.8]|nr:hypothetical protein [Spiroplasma sp. Tabriz.8]